MKRAVVISSVLMVLVLMGCGDKEEDALFSGDSQTSEQIEFAIPLSSNQYSTIVGEFELETGEINFQVGEFSGGYTLQSANLKGELQSARDTFVENMSNVLKLKEANHDADSSGLRQSIEAAMGIASQGQMIFSGATVRGSAEALTEMRQKGIIVNVPNEKTTQSIKPAMAPQSSSHETWAPYRGTTYISRNCIFNTLFFDNRSGFNAESTYEHETHLYKQYANYGYSWSSNLPRAYKDTQFLDFGGLDNFTIGTLQASSIQPYKEYCAYMALCPESNINSELWIKGQIGYRYPSWIYSIWNVFALQTTIPAMYKSTAPMAGGVSWGY